MKSGETVLVKRGDLLTSERWLASKLDATRRQIRGLLDHLEERTMVVRKNGPAGTVLSICKYEEYQADAEKADHPKSKKRTNTKEYKNKPPIVPLGGTFNSGSFGSGDCIEERVQKVIESPGEKTQGV